MRFLLNEKKETIRIEIRRKQKKACSSCGAEFDLSFDERDERSEESTVKNVRTIEKRARHSSGDT